MAEAFLGVKSQVYRPAPFSGLSIEDLSLSLSSLAECVGGAPQALFSLRYWDWDLVPQPLPLRLIWGLESEGRVKD